MMRAGLSFVADGARVLSLWVGPCENLFDKNFDTRCGGIMVLLYSSSSSLDTG